MKVLVRLIVRCIDCGIEIANYTKHRINNVLSFTSMKCEHCGSFNNTVTVVN